MTFQPPLDAVTASPAPRSIISGPILPTLLRLSASNSLAMLSTALVSVAETAYVGRLGIEPLAGIALVFPFVMLSQTMSAGAMGGGVSSAISRAFGAGDRDRAAVLAWHAAIIGLCGGLLFMLAMQIFGRSLYGLLGGSGVVLDEASTFSHVVFAGSVGVWMTNTLASVLRGTGDMRTPSLVLIAVAVVQVSIGGGFGLGLGGLPQFGMAGVAAGQLVACTLASFFLAWHLLSGRSRLAFDRSTFKFSRTMFADILRVGAVSCISSAQTVLIILIFTSLLANFGTATLAGYGIGARLEFMLIPIAFAVGVASVPMIGMAMGAGLFTRARHVAWIAAAVSAVIVGAIGFGVALWPTPWIALFTRDPDITAAAETYFAWAGPAYAFFGAGLTLYFCSQGAARVGGPVLAGTLRLVIVCIGGWFLSRSGAPAWAMYALVGAAMIVYGIGTIVAVAITRWERRAPTP